MAFTLFPMLPPEIRSPIFLLASPGEPGIVPINVNRECRHEALKIYHELRLGQRTSTGCYIDPSKDSIYILADILPSRTHEDLDAVKNAWTANSLLPNGTAEEFHALEEIVPSTSLDDGFEPSLEYFNRLPHPRTIFRDLLWSPDRQLIFQNFHIDTRTWRMIGRCYIHFRHLLPIHFTTLAFVVEMNPSEPLQQNYQIKDDPAVGEEQWALTEAAPIDAASREEVMKQVAGASGDKLRQRSEAIAFDYVGSYVNKTDQVQGRRPTQPQIKLRYIGLGDWEVESPVNCVTS